MVATGTARGPLMPPRRRPRLPLAPALMPMPTSMVPTPTPMALMVPTPMLMVPTPTLMELMPLPMVPTTTARGPLCRRLLRIWWIRPPLRLRLPLWWLQVRQEVRRCWCRCLLRLRIRPSLLWWLRIWPLRLLRISVC